MSLRPQPSLDPLLEEVTSQHSPETLVESLHEEPGVVLLQSASEGPTRGRYSYVTARPLVSFRCWGSRCETWNGETSTIQFGNPWRILELLLARFEMVDQVDLPFPLGGCFGFWGYDLKNALEPRRYQSACSDLDLPDCQLGFYASLVAFDHVQHRTWAIATGLNEEGKRDEARAQAQLRFWRTHLARPARGQREGLADLVQAAPAHATSSFSRSAFLRAVDRAQRYIRAGDIYQANLSQRFKVPTPVNGWRFFERLTAASPAPYAAYINCGSYQLACSSPELFLRLSGRHVQTRPIKGTRGRAADLIGDAQLAEELRQSPKENAELVMITDLLRNDLGKVCSYGSIQVPELARLEQYAHVQHLVSTVEGELRQGVSHLAALESCFPGGSVTGAPKIRALEIIDELEPVGRGPYTGALGYIGFNRQSQLSIVIRTAVCTPATVYFHSGAGIVADSVPEAEYDETLIKARGFFQALRMDPELALARDELPLCG